MTTQSQPTSESLNILRSLKSIIDSVYTGGIDRVLSYQLQPDGTIKGQFLDHRQLFLYRISPQNKISYVEDEKRRSDAYLEAFYGVRFDARSNKRRQCQQGKPCGESCIARGLKCERGLGGAAALQANMTRKAILSASPGSTNQGSRMNGKVVAAAAVAGTTLGLVVGAKAATAYAEAFAVSNPSHMQQNQEYSPVFPSDEEFAKAEYRSPKPVYSNDKVIGINRRYTVKVGNREFFAKHSHESSISKGIFAYDTAVALGMEKNVLPIRRIYHNGAPLAASPLLNPDDIQRLGDDSKLRKFVKNLSKDDLSQAVLFDYTIHQYDRHSGNFLVRKDNTVLLIDNEATVWDLKIPKELDWIPRMGNPPQSVSSRLDTKKNFFFKHGMDENPNYQISEKALRQFVSKRKEIRDIMSYRYSGLHKPYVDENLRQLDRRFDVMESMLKTGDRRVKHLVNGQPVVKRDSAISKPSPNAVRMALLTVKAAIEEQYGQIDQFVGMPTVKDDVIQGTFRDAGKLFTFEISPDGDIQYQQSQRRDSYLSGYVVGDISAYLPDEIVEELVESTLSRQDAKKRCIKGMACGSTCLPQGSTCRVSLPPKRRRAVRQASVILRQSDLKLAALGGGLLLGTAAVAGATAAGIAVTVANQRSANRTLKRAEEERQIAEAYFQKAEEEKKAAEEAKKAAEAARSRPKAKAVNRVVASAIEAGVPAALAGIPAGPVGIATAGATAAGIAAVREYGKISSERLMEGGPLIPEDRSERIALGAATIGGAAATGVAIHRRQQRRQQQPSPPSESNNEEPS